jgi:phosphomannomutase
MSIFKAYDIRGVYGKDITGEVASKLGRSLGTMLKGKGQVCVGYDTRPSSKPLFQEFTSGLMSTGCDVIDLGLVTNPMTYFYARKNKIFGCHITASHNPSNWNGFKLINPKGISFLEEGKTLERIFNAGKFVSGKGKKLREKEPFRDYQRILRGRFGKLDCRIVVDFLGGAGIRSSPILKETGIDAIKLHGKPNAHLYGFHMLEPWGVLLDSAKKAVKRSHADFGVAYDCDADRSIFISPDGQYVDPSVMVGIFSKHELQKRKGKVVATFDCASEVQPMVKGMGGSFSWSRIGHSFIEKKVLLERAIFAGEDSSHFWFGEFYPFSDGLLSTLELCRIIKERDKGFDELIREIRFKPVEKIYFDAKTDEKKERVVEILRKKYPGSIDIRDGFKIRMNDIEWVIVRGSQTLPEINLCVEAKTKSSMKRITKRYSEEIKKLISSR